MRLIDAEQLEKLFREVIGRLAHEPSIINKDMEHFIRASAMAIQMINDAPTVNDPLPYYKECDSCKHGCNYDQLTCSDIIANKIKGKYVYKFRVSRTVFFPNSRRKYNYLIDTVPQLHLNHDYFTIEKRPMRKSDLHQLGKTCFYNLEDAEEMLKKHNCTYKKSEEIK